MDDEGHESSLLVPFLDQSQTYAHGVELGMQVLAPMLRKRRRIRNYFRTENEEQIRLTAGRLGYSVDKIEPWQYEGQDTGWVWMEMNRR